MNDSNHFVPPMTPLPRRRSYSGRWMWRIFGCAILFTMASWLLKAVDWARKAARSSQCYNNFKQIGLALYNYESANDCLPPAYLVDAKGKPTLSWRVLILPYLEERTRYQKFDLSEPWDGPNNIKLLADMPSNYGCPSRPEAVAAGLTKCVAITGPGTFFPGEKTARFADALDGLDQSILVAEVHNVDIPWTAPVDLDTRTTSFSLNDRAKPGISSPHDSWPTISLANGSLKRLPRSITPEELKALITIAGHEPIKAADILSR